jgi:hypothetical protein
VADMGRTSADFPNVVNDLVLDLGMPESSPCTLARAMERKP